MNKHPRSGSKFYKGVEIPINAKIYISKTNREFILYAINSIVEFMYIDDKTRFKVELQKGLEFLKNN